MSANPDDGMWELAGAVRVARDGTGWTLLGGWEEDGAVGLRLLVHHPSDDELVRRLEVRIPLLLDGDGSIEVGPAEVIRP